MRKYDDTRLALAAYNAGQANVDGWLAEGEGSRSRDARVMSTVLEIRDIYARAYANELDLAAS